MYARMQENGYSSMSQDVMNCRKTEIDAINGAIVEQAKLYNVAAPYNRLIVDLIHAIEESYKYQKLKQQRTGKIISLSFVIMNDQGTVLLAYNVLF